jgi:2'-5' RNA ligase
MRREDTWLPHVTVLRDPQRPSPQSIVPIPWRVDAFELMASAEGKYEVFGRWVLS